MQTTPHSQPFGFQEPDFGIPLRPLVFKAGHPIPENEHELGIEVGLHHLVF
jgi:hypothetical protein